MIVVVGGGPAGRYAAMRLAGAGREVTLIDRRNGGLGGQCLHQGCMVICALNDVARSLDQFESLSRGEAVDSLPTVNFPMLVNRMKETIGILAGVINKETTAAGVNLVSAEARIQGRRIWVDGSEIPAEALVIATGSRPKQPAMVGADLPGVYTAYTILSLPAIPKRLTIIGGGAIAVEFAYIFSVFGSHVTLCARTRLLREFPIPLEKEAMRDLHRVRIIKQISDARIIGGDRVEAVNVMTPAGSVHIKADAVLLATGMEPASSGISGIPLGESGEILVNNCMETGVPGVYAAGDVTGSSWLTPLARRQGRIAADTILGIDPPADLIATPQAVKLKNDLAFCGTFPEGALTVTIPSPAGPGSFWAVPDRQTGRISMAVDPDTGKILGMLEASPYASVVAAYHALLMNGGGTVHDLMRFTEVHPSADGTGWVGRYLAEEITKREETRDIQA